MRRLLTSTPRVSSNSPVPSPRSLSAVAQDAVDAEPGVPRAGVGVVQLCLRPARDPAVRVDWVARRARPDKSSSVTLSDPPAGRPGARERPLASSPGLFVVIARSSSPRRAAIPRVRP